MDFDVAEVVNVVAAQAGRAEGQTSGIRPAGVDGGGEGRFVRHHGGREGSAVGTGDGIPPIGRKIGGQLGLSRHTIADYVKQIYRKLNVSSRAEAALEAQRLGLFRR